MGTTGYDKDVILWAQEQAALLRSGQFSQLDLEHLADEIEDVGKSEKRELASRMAVLLAHLLKWQHQPERRQEGGPSMRSWSDTIEHQRERIDLALKETPSLKAVLRDPDWQRATWIDATALAAHDTGFARAHFGKTCPWTTEQVLAPDWMPS